MPRRPPVVHENIPLRLIPHVVKREVCTHGYGLERITVKKTRCHFYSVSIRTRPMKRELKGSRRPCLKGEVHKSTRGGEPA